MEGTREREGACEGRLSYGNISPPDEVYHLPRRRGCTRLDRKRGRSTFAQ